MQCKPGNLVICAQPRLDHPNVVTLFEIFEDSDTLSLVTLQRWVLCVSDSCNLRARALSYNLRFWSFAVVVSWKATCGARVQLPFGTQRQSEAQVEKHGNLKESEAKHVSSAWHWVKKTCACALSGCRTIS